MTPADINEHWDKVLPALEKYFPGHPEILRETCNEGRADFLIVPEGFVIICTSISFDTGKRELFAWFAFGEGEDLIQKYQGELVEYGRSVGASHVVMRTSVDGIAAMMPGLGWKRRHIDFSLEIPA